MIRLHTYILPSTAIGFAYTVRIAVRDTEQNCIVSVYDQPWNGPKHHAFLVLLEHVKAIHRVGEYTKVIRLCPETGEYYDR